MNELAQKRIREIREKVAAAVNKHLTMDLSEAARGKLFMTLAGTALESSKGAIFNYLQTRPEREEAIIAASKFDCESIETFLLEQLKKPHALYREVIIEQLGLKKREALVSLLKPFLADPDRHVRFQTIHSLFNIGGREAALAMCEFISDPDEWISMTILRLLCIMRELDSIPILAEKYYQDDDLRRKALMISFLARFRSVTLLGIFDQGIQARDARLRANSIEAVGNLNLPAAEIRSRIEPSLRDPNNRIRANSILALARLDPEKIKPEIAEMVNSNDVQLRRSAAFILGMIPSDDYHDLAAILVVDQNDAVRKRMIQSLRNFSSEFVCNQLEKALGDADKWIRKHAVDMAARVSNFPHKKVLTLLKTERAAPNLAACMNFFAAHPVEEALGPIKMHVKDRRLPVVKAFLNAMASIGGMEGVKSVAPRLEQKDPSVTQALSEVLIKAGGGKTLDDLVEKFAQARNENQVITLVPSLLSSLEILGQGDNMPEPLLRSLESVAVEIVAEPPESPVITSESLAEFSGADTAGLVEIQGEEPELTLDFSSNLPDLSTLGSAAVNEKMPTEDSEADADKTDAEKHSIHYRQGLKAYNIGKYKKAITEFNRVLETDEHPPKNVFLYMGIIYSDQENYEQARDYLQTFLQKAPDHEKALFLLGKIYKQLKNWDGMIKIYSRFVGGELKISPKMKMRVYHDLGIAQILIGKYQEGLKLLSALLKKKPEDAEVAYYAALAQFHLENLPAAATILQSAVKNAVGNKRIARLIDALAKKIRGEEN
ncbi:MAG: tetratricopeptide repeat protein [Erysipelotrichia bacterium]|nr:tetratricopeptide repeat protein [Erysipelotrichia bacterium]